MVDSLCDEAYLDGIKMRSSPMNPIRHIISGFLCITLIAMGCTSPSSPTPDFFSYDVNVVDLNNSPLIGATIWHLNADGTVIEQKTIGTGPVRFELDRGTNHSFIAYKSGLKADQITVTSRRDSTLTRMLTPFSGSFGLNISAQWPNGTLAPLSNIQAFVSVGSVTVDTLLVDPGATQIHIPRIANELRLKITATDCDTLVLDVNTLGTTPSTAVLIHQGEVKVTYQLTVKSAYMNWQTGLSGVSVTQDHNGNTVMTDATGMAHLWFHDADPRTITIQSDQHEPLTVPLPQPSGNHTVYLDPNLDSMVPLFEVNVDDVWHFTGRNLSTSMSLTTTINSTFEWRLSAKQPGENGSTLLTFISSGSGTRSHPYQPPSQFEINDTLVIRETSAGYWEPVVTKSLYPLSGWFGFNPTQLFPPQNAQVMTVQNAGQPISSILRRFRRIAPAGTTEISAANYRINSTGLVFVQISPGSGGNTSYSNTMTRVYPTE